VKKKGKSVLGSLEKIHTELAVAIAFLNRGPAPEKIGEPATSEGWSSMCGQLAKRLAEIDQEVLELKESLTIRLEAIGEAARTNSA
jgi:hypothetical protein